MKPLRYLFLALSVFFAAPFAVGLIDGWAWIFFDDTLTGIVWKEGRALVAWAFLLPALGFGLACGAAYDAADR